jgi:hypothetical protein
VIGPHQTWSKQTERKDRLFRFLSTDATSQEESRRFHRSHGLFALAVGAVLAASMLAPQVTLAGNPCTNLTMSSDAVSSTVSIGTFVHLTAHATCSGTPVYQWFVGKAQGQSISWQQDQAYSTSSAYAWNTSSEPADSYYVSVWVESQGGPGGSFDTNAALPFKLQQLIINPGNVCLVSCGSGSPANLPADLVLYPNGTWTSVAQGHDENDTFYCFFSDGYGPDLSPSSPNVAVGFSHYHDPGTPPFPCWEWTDTVYRGAVQFNWVAVANYVQDHGMKSATLSYSAQQGHAYCVAQVEEGSDDVSSYGRRLPSILPGGQSLTPSPQLSNGSNSATVDLAGMIAFGQIWGGISNDHLHFIFIGADESLTEQSNTACDAELGNFKITITPDY